MGNLTCPDPSRIANLIYYGRDNISKEVNVIKISQVASTDSDLKKFGKVEWGIANEEHYGSDTKHDYNQKDATLKATQNGRVVGSLKCSHEAGVLYINYLIVAHDKKGQGVGRALMEKAQSFGKKLNAHKIHLTTGLGWEAEKFYQTLGFERIAILPDHHFHKDFVVYEKLI